MRTKKDQKHNLQQTNQLQTNSQLKPLPPDAPMPRLCRVRSSRHPDEKLGFTIAGSKLNPGLFKVINLMEFSPAAVSGLKNEDIIVEVAGRNVQSWNYFEVIDLVKSIKMQSDIELLVADANTVKWYTARGYPIRLPRQEPTLYF